MTETTSRKLPTADDVLKAIPVPSATDTVKVRGDALGEVIWQGKQWAVTADGLEARDGTYYIAASRLREEEPDYSWPQHMAEKTWVDVNDFNLAFAVACWAHRGEPFVMPEPAKEGGDDSDWWSRMLLNVTVTDTDTASPSRARAFGGLDLGGRVTIRDMVNALERCIQSQEALARQIEKANPDDPYAALMLHEDIDTLREAAKVLATLEA